MRDYLDYVFFFKKLGQLVGDMFKYIWTNRVIGQPDRQLYVYPDSDIEIEDPQFNQLKFPGYNYDLYPDFEELWWTEEY